MKQFSANTIPSTDEEVKALFDLNNIVENNIFGIYRTRRGLGHSIKSSLMIAYSAYFQNLIESGYVLSPPSIEVIDSNVIESQPSVGE